MSSEFYPVQDQEQSIAAQAVIREISSLWLAYKQTPEGSFPWDEDSLDALCTEAIRDRDFSDKQAKQLNEIAKLQAQFDID